MLIIKDLYNLLITIDISDFLILIIGLIGSLFLNINNSDTDKQSNTKFILSYYSLVIIYFAFSQTLLKIQYHDFIPIALLLIVHMSKSMSLAIFRNDTLIHYLNPFQILLYYYFEVFFTSRLEVVYIYAFLIIPIPTNQLKIVISVVFLLLQLLIQIKNNFEVISFESLNDIIFKQNKKEITLTKPLNEELLLMLSFVLYMEDRDFVKRSGFVFNPLIIIFRKFLLSTGSYVYWKEYQLLDKRNYIKSFGRKINYSNFKLLINFFFNNLILLPKILKNVFSRGYSTIPQQVVRISVLKNAGTYERNKIRRKIFVEYIYTHYFYKAITRRYSKSIMSNYSLYVDRKNKKEIYKVSVLFIKRDIMNYYYFSLLGEPKSKQDLFVNMRNKVKTSKTIEVLERKWEERYNYGVYHKIYNAMYWEMFNEIEQNIEQGL